MAWLLAAALIVLGLLLTLGAEVGALSARTYRALGTSSDDHSGEYLLPRHPAPLAPAAAAAAALLAMEVHEALSARAKGAPSASLLAKIEVIDSSRKGACGVGVHGGELLVVFRGTLTFEELQRNDFGTQFLAAGSDVEWLARLGLPLPFPQQTALAEGAPRIQVNEAFLTTLLEVEEAVRQAAARLPTGAPLWVAGHSLGAAVAALFAARRVLARDALAPRLRLLLLACPKVGNREFRELLLQVPCVHFVNENDAIPALPFAAMPDFAGSGTLEYVAPPAPQTFSFIGPTLLACHSTYAYITGLSQFLVPPAAKRAAPP
jgi:hypothetical protein